MDVKGFEMKKGVFVTIKTYPDKNLRGCIGIPYPWMALKEAIIECARSAAYSDPRFKPLSKKEDIVIELSILTEPEEINVSIENCQKKILIGSDGLIIEYKNNFGILLPQVFEEFNCKPLDALEMVCEKAGLMKNAWKKEGAKVFKFQAEIFSEISPDGKIEKK